jgi:hypothetical protein
MGATNVEVISLKYPSFSHPNIYFLKLNYVSGVFLAKYLPKRTRGPGATWLT